MMGIYVLFCCSSLLVFNHVCADVNCPTDSEEKLQFEQCDKEVPQDKPGCLVKCMLKANNLLGDNGIPIADKIAERVENCADKRSSKEELQKIVTCLRDKIPNVKPDEPDCKSFSELMKCYPDSDE